ncbi:MAG: ferredoxin [Bacteroidales bacterium]|nr:ferredoxin [Bacteroidales bacterium]
MAIIREEVFRKEVLLEVAKKMVVAARTAPKARGIDNLAMAIVTDGELQQLCKKTKEIGDREDYDIFLRDAVNVLNSADVLVLIGTRFKSLELKFCGYCGFNDCATKEKHPDVPCAFNTSDLGIAVGSAVALAADHRVDSRVMYTIGLAARELNLLGEEYKIVYGIPLSATSKNPFFDRK